MAVELEADRPLRQPTERGLVAMDRDLQVGHDLLQSAKVLCYILGQLFAWADLRYDETATALSIPIGTVRSRLHRARTSARTALGNTNPLDPMGARDT
jgi:DNA-directed RNA polymerase specialized sigma24 family protein